MCIRDSCYSVQFEVENSAKLHRWHQEPVSYTHLDVYKRQHQETPDACGRKDRTPSFLKDDVVCHKYSADTYLLQIYLYGKFDELLRCV